MLHQSMFPNLSPIRWWTRAIPALCACLVLGSILGLIVSRPPSPAQRALLSPGIDPFHSVFRLETPLQVSATPASTSATTRFVLPDGAEQGKPIWYLLDVLLYIEFDMSVPPSAGSYINVSTNGYSATLAHFVSDRVNDRSMVRWDNLDLLNGNTSGVLFDGSFTMHFRNYLQISGVRPV